VDDFVGRVASDPRVNFTRKGHPNEWDPSPANVAKLKKRLVQFLGMATGGPQKYEGRSLADAHRHMRITDAEYDAAASHLKATLEKFKVPQREQVELLSIIDAVKGDIVGK
jgi:hemoglobin